MQRYFVLNNSSPVLDDRDVFHIKKVMRMKKGDRFELFFNNKIFLAEIESLEPFNFNLLHEIIENNELNGYIRLLYCIPKGEKLDLVVQKAVELGVKEIVLINSSRSIAKIESKNKNKKLERLNRIIKEASEQSKRSEILKLTDVISFSKITDYPADYSFIAYEKDSKCDNIEILSYLNKIKGKTINILIGPEGGFSKEEVEYSCSNSFISTSLGRRILRSETAVFSLVSLLSYFMN